MLNRENKKTPPPCEGALSAVFYLVTYDFKHLIALFQA